MDDLAIPLTAKHNDQLIQNVKVATGLILDTLRVHAITPNLQKGKAELLVHPKGPGTHALKRHLFGPDSTGKLDLLGEYGPYSVSVVTMYSHLGGLTHYTGDLRREVRHQSFNKHRKIIYQNRSLPVP